MSQKKQHIVILKEIRLRPKIDIHDLKIKVDHAIKFIEKGNKVQFTMLFRGREMMHVENGYKVMEQIVETIGELGQIERSSKMMGRRMTMIIIPAK